MLPVTESAALTLFEKLLSVPSPSGRENRLAALIIAHLEKSGYQPERDAAGNVLVRLEGGDPAAPRVIYAAHMDEIGFTITHIHPDGSLQAMRSGGLFPWKAGEGPVDILAEDDTLIPGVLSFGSTHAAGSGKRGEIGWEEARILTGLSPAELAAAGVFPGAAGTLARHVCRPVMLGQGSDPLVGAWTFDDRMGCTVLLLVLQALRQTGRQPHCPTIVAFTTREEVGGYGARFLAERERPDVFIAVDGAPLTPDVDLALDGRPVLWARDSLGPYDHGLIIDLKKAAAAAGVEVQTGAYGTNASDASMAMRSGGAGRIACFGHPRANSHGFEVARLSTFDQIQRTLLAFMTGWTGEGA